MFMFLLPISLCILVNSQEMSLFSTDDMEWGKSLEGHCFGNLDGLSLISCIQECLVMARCLSVNYDHGLHMCYLNDEYSSSNPQEMVDRDDHVFIDMFSLEHDKLTGICAEVACPLHEKCVISNGSCVLSDCPAPPSKGNALVSDGGSLIGDQRYYTCADGYTAKGDRVITCGADGKWGTINLKCTFVGNQRTKDVLKDCKSIYDYNQSARDGIYEVSPDGIKKFNASCDMSGGGWTLIQTRQATTEVNFERPYNDYIDTFGDLRGDHWIGLENIRLLTSVNSYLKLDVITTDSDDGQVIFHNFTLSGSEGFYKLILDSDFENYGCLSNINKKTVVNKRGLPFTTSDQDNDQSKTSNCADKYGAYWHKNCCILCNINNNRSTIFIMRNKRSVIKLQKVTLKVRRI